MRHRKASVDLADAAVPTRTSLALSRNCWRLFLLSRRLLARPDEVRSIAPHAVEGESGPSRRWRGVSRSNRRLPCHRDLGLLEADAFPQPVTPGFELSPLRHSGEQQSGSLEEVGPAHSIAAFGDPTAPVDLTRGIAARRLWRRLPGTRLPKPALVTRLDENRRRSSREEITWPIDARCGPRGSIISAW